MISRGWAVAVLVWGSMIVLVVSLAGCDLLREPQVSAPPNATLPIILPTTHLTADEVARAMQEDRFFADYGNNTLLIEGKALSVNRQENDLIVTLDTSVEIKVLCDIGNHSSSVQVGDTVTIKSDLPRRDASRQTSAVLFKNCTIQ